jgi:hypothetical protein
MSHMADLQSTFERFQKMYKWSPETTAENFLEVIGCLEWELDYKKPPEIWNDATQRMQPDYQKEAELELREAVKLFK